MSDIDHGDIEQTTGWRSKGGQTSSVNLDLSEAVRVATRAGQLEGALIHLERWERDAGKRGEMVPDAVRETLRIAGYRA